MIRILTLNFGGTSAKLAIYEDTVCVEDFTLDYSREETDLSCTSRQEIAIKKANVLRWLDGLGLQVSDFDAFAPRFGGMFYGGDGGTFVVEGDLLAHLDSMYTPEKPAIHATHLTMELIHQLMEGVDKDIPVLTTDPSTINQFLPEARITGNPLFYKRAAFHALNQRAAARKAAERLGKRYDQVNLVVAHCGGVSVGAHEKGRIIDVNDSSGDGDGPFSPNRAGTLPTGQLVHLCYSGQYTERQAFKLLKGQAGLQAYLGTDDLREAERRVESGDPEATLIFRALAYQISREIGACCATLCGRVDGIVITAGMAYCKPLVRLIEARVGAFAPVIALPGAFENEALALGAYRVLTGQEQPAVYQGEALNMQPAYWSGSLPWRT